MGRTQRIELLRTLATASVSVDRGPDRFRTAFRDSGFGGMRNRRLYGFALGGFWHLPPAGLRTVAFQTATDVGTRFCPCLRALTLVGALSLGVAQPWDVWQSLPGGLRRRCRGDKLFKRCTVDR